MNFNRRRNVFTLGDFQQHQSPHKIIKAQLSRRKNSDPFERDPFKIQSYNFHYAERPTYPLQNLVNRVSNNTNAPNAKRFETYFYNHDFTPARNDKENFATSKFHEHRRRKFLHDQSTSADVFGHTGRPIMGRAPLSQFQNTTNRQQYQIGQYSSTGAGACGGAGAVSGASRPLRPSSSPKTSTAVNVSAYTTPTASPLLRSGCTREYMQGMCASYTPFGQKESADIHNNLDVQLNQAKAGSRPSLACNTVADRRPSHTSQHCSSSTTALFTKSGREPSNLKSSVSRHSQQSPVRLQFSSQNLMAAKGKQHADDDACSCCQINISIKTQDPNQMGENVTINIDTSDNNAPNAAAVTTSGNNTNASRKPSRLMIPAVTTTSLANKSQYNILPNSTSETFVIDKRLSKFNIQDRSQSVCREIQTPSRLTKCMSKERLPSMVPWRLAMSSRTSSGKDKLRSNPIVGQMRSLTSDVRCPPPRYPAPLTEKRSTLNLADRCLTGYSVATSRTKPSVEHKMCNAVTSVNQKLNTTILRQMSQHSMRSPTEVRNVQKHLVPMSRSSIHILQHSSTTQSSSSHNLKTNPNHHNHSNYSSHQNHSSHQNQQNHQNHQNLRNYQIHQNPNKLPLNVNINVFAEKLKLLRV